MTLAIDDRGPGLAPARARYRCHLVVPAFNEEDRIARCLEAVLASPLPGRCSWSEWVILDGASMDATVERALATARRIPDMPALRILTAPQRQGKAADLGAWHRRLLAEGADAADVVVIVDADAAPEHHSIAAILRPLLDDEGLGVVWGTDRPDDTSIGRWASTFQMRLVDGLWRARGAETPRAYGRFLAYRPAALSAFSWQSDVNVDDVQLAEWVEREGVPVSSAGQATVLVTPAGSQHDFSKQTVRYWTAVPDAATALGRTDSRGGLPVAARLAAAHPLMAGAYLVARLRAQRTHRHDRAELNHLWSPPVSTKGPVDRPGRTVKQERLVPHLRNPHVTVDNVTAQMRAAVGHRSGPFTETRPPIFVLGCGRSGTTILGRLLADHPGAHYLYEPNARWAVVDPRTDYLQLYRQGEAFALMDETHAGGTAARRFAAAMQPRRGRVLVEKTPINALRLGYLEALAPGARYIHIVRNGVDVARSIEEYAATTVRYPGRPPFNTWWGIADAKWDLLTRDAVRAGYPDVRGYPTTDAQRGAYEWVVSLLEVQRRRELLGARLVEIRHADLVADPEGSLLDLARRVGLDADEAWAAASAQKVRPSRARGHEPLPLPGPLAPLFDRLQARHGFPHRSTSPPSR